MALVAACAPVLTGTAAPSAAPAASAPGASAPDARCPLVQVAAGIPAEIRAAITAARTGDAPASQEAMQRAQAAASELHRQVEAMGSRLVVTTRARFVSAESFAQQADEVFLGTAPGLPDAQVLLQLERGVTQLESVLAGVAAPCSS